ncbi:MAG: hypothetical protein QGH33_15015 [Pirellulaceae bacterium]|jgi:hypothetical protein|nr:hypothetical protein [Pirellulaceae bacterium]HJN12091.1 hypothetical protein [Pirellulaceae bacterium]
MSRRLRLLTSAALLCVAVAAVVWLRGQDEQNGPQVSVAQAVNQRDPEPSDLLVDPGAAVATIHAVRSQFGSVLANSELDVADSHTRGVDIEDSLQSFDDFLRMTAGVTDPSPVEVDEVDRASSKLADVAPLPNGGLAQSMRETATLLVRRAQQAKETGDATQQLRFSGLATLLRAEADLLDWDRRVER